MKANQQHVEQCELLENNEIKAIKTINSSVFDYFKNLTSDVEQKRINAGLDLLQYFTKIQNDVEKEKEFHYALRRLIRGLGASTTISRAGFFTTFVGFLKLFLFNGVDVETIVNVCKKQLHTGKTLSNKEDSDAIVGKILTCGAILRSNKITNVSSDDLKSIFEILISSSKYKSYHNSLAFSFIVEIIQNVTENQFHESVWPLIETELKISWNKQTLNTLNCLLKIQKRFPNILSHKYCKVNFGGSQLLNSESSKYLYKLFWENNTTDIITHPVYENFGSYIANCKYLKEFWIKILDEKLSKSNKLIEIETLKIFTDILLNKNINNNNEVKISDLLTNNFIKMIITTLKNMKLKKDETLKAFYDDYFDALNKYCSKFTLNAEDNNEKFNIVCKLILYPGIINIEKYTSNRIIHQILVNFNENDIAQLFEIYKKIFLNNLIKNPEDKNDIWLNNERQHSGYMLQTLINHKNVQNASEWKTEQLKFMMKIGLFHTNEKGEISNENNNDNNDDDSITNEFSLQMKNMFYSNLQTKLSKLKDRKCMLIELIETCNEILKRKNFNKFLRVKINEKTLKIWNEMYVEVHKSDHQQQTKNSKNKNKNSMNKNNNDTENVLELVFHILLLNMGLQLFKEPDMAETAILDLKKCLEKTKNKKSFEKDKKKSEIVNNNSDDEPEWIEVVTDLFLHLLSQNVNSLRIVVNSLFPYLCDKLTLTSIHQILSVLDMANESNPLTDNDKELEENSDEEKKGNIDEAEDEDDDDDEDEDDDENDDNDDDDDEIMGEEEEESTITDRLRNAVSTALSSVTEKDDDQSSIDLDDMDEEEGKRLDEALATAFRAVKKSQENNKRSKTYRVKTTTLVHFRIRVLDLIEIYIHNPRMLYSIEILLSLYNMIEYCTEIELKPLALKLDKVLLKLTSLRHFSNIDQDINDINEKNICDYLRLIIEKKVKPTAVEMHNKFKAKCCVFLISCTKILSENRNSNETVDSKQNGNSNINEISHLLVEYLSDFLKSRNPVINITLLSDLFKIRWLGIWQLIKFLINNGLNDETIRTFRRIQILELLDILYNNYELMRQNMKITKKELKFIENQLQNYVSILSEKSNTSIREFSLILNVLYSMNKCHNKIEISNHIDKEIICNYVQNIRRKIKLENMHSYSRFCTVFGIKTIKNSELNLQKEEVFDSKSNIQANGVEKLNNSSKEEDDKNDDDDEQEEQGKIQVIKKNKTKKNKSMDSSILRIKSNVENTAVTNGDLVKKRKNQEDNRKEKKLKKEKRMKISSEGLNGGISFKTTFEEDTNVSD